MKKSIRKSLLTAALVPVTVVAVGAAVPSAALAQAMNPCAPAAGPANPCAPAMAPANPCAPAAAPAAAKADEAALPKGMYDTTTKYKQAAFGNQMPNIVENYLRAVPYIGTGGLIEPTGMDMLASLGFKTIVSLNTDEEGAAAERPLVEKAGMTFIDIGVTTKAPTNDQVAEFAKIAEDPNNYPILVHCESANRVGAMWALYRASKGIPKDIAIEEGRTIGLKTSREPAVRDMLGMPAL
ncbi:Protein tyrosine/serine phosphatase [Hartmannibacter diazotrophicus]|uniref:Protein tyrosine/serine phosphatase n=1 Tax=Hartmannibacter diazotrophicus TaxID=1482074 RepID=A0A2C9D7V8_9HYPH|nr:sulfur transferase domain-containing protein [Hartmannibacter diazotrophicus]SON56333.1 Protein tyrosine/serine phosphatase [Hartmannibacter diazotrophicus]